MAHVGRKVEVARKGDVTVGRVDSRTGLLAQRERIEVRVPKEDGRTAVVMRKSMCGVEVVSTFLYLSTYIYMIYSFSIVITTARMDS